MIYQKTMREALKRIRQAEREARAAAERCDDYGCYTALKRCQQVAGDAARLFDSGELQYGRPKALPVLSATTCKPNRER